MDSPAGRQPLRLSRLWHGFEQTVLGDLGLPIALGAAFLVVLPLIRRVHIAEYDEVAFLDAAHNVARNGLPLRSIGAAGIPLIEHPPLYFFMLSLYAPAAGNSLFFARSVTLAAALLCIVLTYKIAAIIGGRAAGFTAALFLALNPFFAVYSYFIRMEIFMVAAVLLAVFLLVRRQPPSMIEILLAGCALAAGCMLKEFAVVFAVPAAVYVWLTARGSFWRRSRAMLILAAPPVIAFFAWALWARALWPAEFASAAQRWLHSAVGGAVLDPRMSVGPAAWTEQLVVDLFRPGLLLALLAALLALVLLRRRPSAAEALLWGYVAAAVALSYFIRLRELRYLIAVIPCAAILGGVGLASLYRAGRGAARPSVMAGVAGLAVVLLLLAAPWQPERVLASGPSGEALTPTYRGRLLGNDPFYGVLAQTGAVLRRITEPAEVVVVAHQGPVVAYYADRHYMMLYTLNETAIMRVLAQARFLVWDAPTFLALDADAIARVEAAVQADFVLQEEVSRDGRTVGIYRRK
jgi:4-amino-4-deoxy-L-arabinose transferase-like glycosyltransferase